MLAQHNFNFVHRYLNKVAKSSIDALEQIAQENDSENQFQIIDTVSDQ